ncbi:MAG: UDP-2,3-diacylglucosamine diphosphatase LpxI [Rhizobiales bacterium]|nr:UDP-2,3-diacylglucosamine diphosphatase LpxI [Hyphomicrobiales bacterium]
MTDQSASQPTMTSPVGLIAGTGVLPFAVADTLARRGIQPVIFALKGFCDPREVQRFRHHWIALGKFGALVSLLKAERCRDVTLIGGLVRPSLSDLKLDFGALALVPAFIAGLRGGDDHLLTTTAGFFEARGFRVRGIRDLAPELLMPEGCMTRARPDRDAEADIARGDELLRATGPFDIGQAAVVIDGHVVSVEDIEGTDALLARIARLRAEGRLRGKPGRGVLVKAPKQGQDLRLDLPAVGPRTVEGLAAAGLAGAAIAAGHAVVAEPQAMVEAADKAGVFIVGVPA